MKITVVINWLHLQKKDSKWKDEYLMIPDRDAKNGITHPLEQIRWTNEKHVPTNKTYKKVVRALKWRGKRIPRRTSFV